jgi:hypothetical protein
MLAYLLVHLGLCFVFVTVVVVAIRKPLRMILLGLVEQQIAEAFLSLISFGLYIAGVCSGVGFPDQCCTALRNYRCNTCSTEPVEWFLLVYRALAASAIGVGSVLAVLVFSTIVLHVGLTRLRFSQAKSL